MELESFNTITIDTSALENNYRAIVTLAGERIPVMAMVKADGYGHGMVQAAQTFSRAGCNVFGVAEIGEAVVLRGAGIPGEIYVTIGFSAACAPLFFEHQLTPVVYNQAQALALSQEAKARNTEIGIHIKVDTGMGRLGIFPHELSGFTDSVSQLPGITIAGVMSHFPSSDEPHVSTTRDGFEIFSKVCRDLKIRYNSICHIANSGAVFNFPTTHCDMIRAGIALYGYHPAGSGLASASDVEKLTPAMSFTTEVIQVKDHPIGSGISYGHTYVTPSLERIAVLPVGYEDGFSRRWSNCGEVLVHGQRAPVRGRVCMNMSMVDVTDIKGVTPGSEVVILGSQGREAISADDLAAGIGTISYEILCTFGNSNCRKYI